MIPEACHIALKEWAVTVDALGTGRQVLLLRKGGISESGKHFRVAHPEFLLYPTFEHQREDLLKDAHQIALRALLAEPHDAGSITFSYWAQAAETIEVLEQGLVEALSPHHIWTDDYSQSRLRWKPRFPSVGDAAQGVPAGAAGDRAVFARVQGLHVMGGVVQAGVTWGAWSRCLATRSSGRGWRRSRGLWARR